MIFLVLALTLGSYVFYQLYLHPLAAFPGPFWAKVNPLWPIMLLYKGQRHKAMRKLHSKYGDHVRVGINTLSICHIDADRSTRGHGTKFIKDKAYDSMNVDPHVPSFSSERNTATFLRMKRVFAPEFSQKAIDVIEEKLAEKVKLFCSCVRKFGHDGETPLDISQWLSHLMFDFLGIFCFGKSYGMLEAGVFQPLHDFIETSVIIFSYGFLMSWIEPVKGFLIPKSLSRKREAILEDYKY